MSDTRTMKSALIAIAACLAFASGGQLAAQVEYQPLDPSEEAHRQAEAILKERLERALEYERELRRTRVTIAGTSTGHSSISELDRRFRDGEPDAPKPIHFIPGGTEVGIREFVEEGVDFALLRRQPTEEEWTSIRARVGGRKPEVRTFIRTALTIVAERSAPVQSLSIDQLRRIFQGEIAYWPALDEWPQEISRNGRKHPGENAAPQIDGPVARQAISRIGTKYPRLSREAFFLQVLNGKSEPFPDDGKLMNAQHRVPFDELMRRLQVRASKFPGRGPYPWYSTDDEVVAEVSKTRGSVGYVIVPLGAELPEVVRVLPISSADDTEAILPTRENILLDRYPLVIRVDIMVHPDAKPIARRFVDFVCGESAVEVVAEHGFLHELQARELRMKRRADKAGNGELVP